MSCDVTLGVGRVRSGHFLEVIRPWPASLARA